MTTLVTLGCGVFIAYLFWSEWRRDGRGFSPALWVPFAWMFLAGSRWASSWLSLDVPLASANDYSEGSPVDRAVFLTLIGMGVLILAQRAIDWGTLLSRNAWLVAYLLFALSSVLWAPEPYVLFKRWVKDLGNPIMALVILTDQRSYEAIGAILRRLAFVLLPLSALFIRYYPDLGRAYHVDGTMMFTGVGHQKNDLGLICLVSGLALCWKLLRVRGPVAHRQDPWRWHDWVLLGLTAWLLTLSNSKTSLACLLVAIGVLMLMRIPAVQRQPTSAMIIALSIAATFALLEAAFGVKDFVFELLGRDASLTNRTTLWEAVKRHAANPIVGAGFMSFWTGATLEAIWKELGAGINQAHSGYLEQYLNLGYIGVAAILAIMVAALAKIQRQIGGNPDLGILRLALVLVAALYNYTEASFYGINNMWMLLLLASIDVSGQRSSRAARKPLGDARDRQLSAFGRGGGRALSRNALGRLR